LLPRITALTIELTLKTKVLNMENIANTNSKRPLHMTEFELDGHKCLRFFDPDTGELCVFGPMETWEAQARYLARYAPVCRDQSLRKFVASIRPETDINQKINAILVLMEEYKEEMALGMKISPELVVEVLDSFDPWEPMEPGALSLINSLEN
jgi:hypothetical protein